MGSVKRSGFVMGVRRRAARRPKEEWMFEEKNAEDIFEAELVFHEQADGRMVAKIAGGKAVLIDVNDLGRVKNGERWRVRLQHHETFAIASLIEPCADNPVLPSTLGEALRISAPPAPAAPAPAVPAPPEAVESVRPAPRTPVDPRRIVQPSDRVALFVDGANMDWACRRAGYFIDYGKAREFFQAGGIFYAGYFYIADFSGQDPQQVRFLDFLAQSGFIVRRHPVKTLHDEDTGEPILKCNLDTEIVLDMLNTVDNYDVAFLFSGDSDFERAVDLLRSRGKRVYVVSSVRQLSRELMYAADKPIFFIENYRPVLGRDGRKPEAGA